MAKTNIKKEILKTLEKVLDPEINISVVDLGLIYEIKETFGKVDIKMTLTNPGCPLADLIINDIKESVLKVKGVNQVDVEVVFDPPWTKDRLSKKAKAKLGL